MTNEDTPVDGEWTQQSLHDDLLLELAAQVETIGGGTKTVSRVIARRLIERGLAGDVSAIREIHDRVVGKPPKAPPPQPRTVKIEWKWISAPTPASECPAPPAPAGTD